jgi:hypothetical protein
VQGATCRRRGSPQTRTGQRHFAFATPHRHVPRLPLKRLPVTMAVMPFGFVTHRCRCTLPRHVSQPWLPRHARAGYQRCGRESDAPLPGAEHTRVLGNDGAPHPLASFPERAPVGVATRCACYRVSCRAASTRAHPGAAPRRAGTPLSVLCSAFAS